MKHCEKQGIPLDYASADPPARDKALAVTVCRFNCALPVVALLVNCFVPIHNPLDFSLRNVCLVSLALLGLGAMGIVGAIAVARTPGRPRAMKHLTVWGVLIYGIGLVALLVRLVIAAAQQFVEAWGFVG